MACLAVFQSFAADKTPVWKDPNVNQVNREQRHAYFFAFEKRVMHRLLRDDFAIRRLYPLREEAAQLDSSPRRGDVLVVHGARHRGGMHPNLLRHLQHGQRLL